MIAPGLPPMFDLGPALAALEEVVRGRPSVFLVLGSGLGHLAEAVEGGRDLPFGEIPGFPNPGVTGHAGRLVAGRLGGKEVLLQAGRFHLYEGHDPSLVVAPVRLAAGLGARTAIFTNAAGGLDPSLTPGSLLLLEDHINLTGRSPLRGPLTEGEERFPEMTDPYDPDLRRVAHEVARDLDLPLRTGTYVGVLGPSYETPAEIRFLAGLNGDVVGMSTVPEVLTARALGMRVLAFSLVTNPAAGLGPDLLDHRDVLEVGRAAGGRLGELLMGILSRSEV